MHTRRSFFGKTDTKSPSTPKSKQHTISKKRRIEGSPVETPGNVTPTKAVEEREGDGPDGADSPVFKRKIKNRKRVIFDSDDEGEKEKEGGEGRSEEEKERDVEVSEKVKGDEREEQKVEKDTQNGGERMENGKREEETEVTKNDIAGIFKDFVSHNVYKQ